MADLKRFPKWAGDKPDELHLSMVENETWARFSGFRAEALDLHGVYITVSRAWASYADQKYYWDLYQAGKGNPAAKPGTSLHESGKALDTSPGWDQTSAPLRALAAKWGLHYPLGTVVASPREPWHLEPYYARGYPTPPMPELPAPAPTPEETDVSDLSAIFSTANHEVEVRLAPVDNAALIRWVDKGSLVTVNNNWAVFYSANGGLMPQPPQRCQDIKPLFFQGRLHLRVWTPAGAAAFVAGLNNLEDDLTRWDHVWYPA